MLRIILRGEKSRGKHTKETKKKKKNKKGGGLLCIFLSQYPEDRIRYPLTSSECGERESSRRLGSNSSL